MASGSKTHTFVRHVENVFYLKDFMTWLVCKMLSDILFLRVGSSSFFSLICEEKSPYKVGRHVERLEIVFMAVCGMSFYTRWAPCREFFKNL